MSDGTPLAWSEIRARLDAANAETHQRAERTPEEEACILKERARDLARETHAVADEGELLEIVEFELAGEHYGIELASVRAVSLLHELTPVPCTPAFVLGVINLRGEIHTVIDLKKFFDLPDAGITQLNKVLILNSPGMRLGILADSIHGVRAIPLGSLDPSPATLTGIRSQFLRGVTGDRLILLDAAKILSDEAILVDDAAGM